MQEVNVIFPKTEKEIKQERAQEVANICDFFSRIFRRVSVVFKNLGSNDGLNNFLGLIFLPILLGVTGFYLAASIPEEIMFSSQSFAILVTVFGIVMGFALLLKAHLVRIPLLQTFKSFFAEVLNFIALITGGIAKVFTFSKERLTKKKADKLRTNVETKIETKKLNSPKKSWVANARKNFNADK